MALSRQPDVAVYGGGGGGTMPKTKRSPKKGGGTSYGGGAATDSGISIKCCTAATNTVSVNTMRPVFNDFRRRSVLCFKLDKVAAQMTLINAALFRELQDNDLSSLKWYHPRKKNEQESDRVTNIARRFNYEVNWVIRQILQEESSRKRAEVFAYFVRLARRLRELNNFHCSFVVTSALQSNPIVRLEKTQKLVPNRDMKDLAELGRDYSQQNNWHLFRNLQESAGQPCLPHIGFYKTDLIHVYHACSSDADRHTKMRTIEKRVFGLFERSNYGFLEEEPALMNYLLDIRYLDELQRFVDDENMKISKALEPDREEEVVVKKVRPCIVNDTTTKTTTEHVKTSKAAVGRDDSDDDSDASDKDGKPSCSTKSGSTWYTRNAAGDINDDDDRGRVLSDETITNDDNCTCVAAAASNSSPAKHYSRRKQQSRSDVDDAGIAAAAAADESFSYESNLTDQLVSMALTAAAAVAAKEHKEKQLMDDGDGESHHPANNQTDADHHHHYQSDHHHHHHHAVNNKSSDYIVTPSGTTKMKKGKKGESFSANDRAAAQPVSLLDDDNTMLPNTTARSSGVSKLLLLKSASLKGRGASKAKKAAAEAAAASSTAAAAAARKKSKHAAPDAASSLKPVRLSTASDIGVILHAADTSAEQQQNRGFSASYAANFEPLRQFSHTASSAALEAVAGNTAAESNRACRHHHAAGAPSSSQRQTGGQSPFEWQGILKCKTTVKDGQLNRFSAWKRYWVGLWDANLVFFQPSSTFSTCRERKQFNKTPSKIKNIAGWHVERDSSKTRGGGGATGWSGLASTDPLFVRHHQQLQQQNSSSSLSASSARFNAAAANDSTPTSTSGSLFGGIANNGSDAVAVTAPAYAVNNSRYSLSSNTSSNSATAGVSLTPTPMKTNVGGRPTIITGGEAPQPVVVVGRPNQSSYNNQWALFENDGADECDQHLSGTSNSTGGASSSFVRNIGGGGMRRKTLPTTAIPAAAAPTVTPAIGGLSSSDSYEVITMQRRYPPVPSSTTTAVTASSTSSTVLPENMQKPNNPFLPQLTNSTAFSSTSTSANARGAPTFSPQIDLERQRTNQYDAFQKYFSRMSTSAAGVTAPTTFTAPTAAAVETINYLSDNENDENDEINDVDDDDDDGSRPGYSTQSSTTPALGGVDTVGSRSATTAARPHESAVKRLLCGASTSSTSPVLSGIGAAAAAASTDIGTSVLGGAKKLKPPKVETIKLSSADRRQTLLVKPASLTEMNEWLRHLFVATARPPDLNLIRLD